MQSSEINHLATALAAAQAELQPASKDAVNPHFKSRYADLQSVWSACRPVLHKHGLSVVQTFEANDGSRLSLTTTLLHSSGQFIGGTLVLTPTKSDPQGLGSAATYARRYALAAIIGVVADEDDDANAASRSAPTKTATPAPRPAPIPQSAMPAPIPPLPPACSAEQVARIGELAEQLGEEKLSVAAMLKHYSCGSVPELFASQAAQVIAVGEKRLSQAAA